MKASRNRTLVLTEGDRKKLTKRLLTVESPQTLDDVIGRTINGDVLDVLPLLPERCVDLLIADPPYNLTKTFGGTVFRAIDNLDYVAWLEEWVSQLPRLLKAAASIYVCCDWRCSCAMCGVFGSFFKVRNRITWEREKGRGAKANWKNAHEDIWFCTMSDACTFNLDAVKLKRRVVAPYRVGGAGGTPKDWDETPAGNYRMTHPSNLWTDLTVPFWSMPENTGHPTQKPEKLLAKLILASSNADDVVFDPFLGSGTTSVVAKKLGRRFFGVERDRDYCLLTEKRLTLAEHDRAIQGYEDGVFWERNALSHGMHGKARKGE
ncbi:MAG: site-specific DNA-methyltransferase [Planctomycetaceae bacterium]|nr:site-specific DNA-methyltransferase [Planctomycetaceae bacterium]